DGDDGLSVLHARLERDGAGPGDRLRRVGEEIQEHLVDLRSNALDRRHPAEGPVHGDPVLEEVIDQREARLELLVQVHGLPDVGVRPGEHAQVADDLAGALGPFANALDHRVDVLEGVVDLELLPALVNARLLGVGERHRAVRTRTLSSRPRVSSSIIWKRSARSTASATWLATADTSSRSPAAKRFGSPEATVSTPKTRSFTRRGTATNARESSARAWP